MDVPLVDKVAETRVRMIRLEIGIFFPNAEITVSSLDDGRASIKMVEEGSIIGVEFIETGTSWDDPRRQRDYYSTLVNKCRLGVIVPIEHARKARLKMLEYNQRWLFYYQVYSYDMQGQLKRIGRPYGDRTEPRSVGPWSGLA